MSSIQSQALILCSKFDPAVVLQDAFRADSVICAFLQASLGNSFYNNPLLTTDVRELKNEDGSVEFMLDQAFADGLWRKVGIILSVLSVAIGYGSYPAPINIPAIHRDIPFLTDFSDIKTIDIDHFPANPLVGLRVGSIQALQEILETLNFALLQYSRWIYHRVKHITQEGRFAQTPIRDNSQIVDLLLLHFLFYRDRDRSYTVAITYRVVANG
ncbi:hypothetical protein K435DRAFT_855591 [Dendrothele bispora CBS 962.96]|uniref:Uncharacterized protein n=1 Tax=Dendrothele bispora (strain CBS 962.96) TaxID=1314807 RepID=A0A4S8MAR8_DENBC|nr:hypothetical protein K435DRAFT_855591 [Dendrothele bispora CBS 962.96]